MKKLTKKQILLIIWAVTITGLCIYALYFFTWGISQNLNSIKQSEKQIVSWQVKEPNEEYSREFIDWQIQSHKNMVEEAKEINIKFTFSTIATFITYVSFMSLSIICIRSKIYISPPPPPSNG